MKKNIIPLVSLFLMIAGLSAKALAQKHYNVLFIVVDDMTDKTSYLGYPQVLTPNLQRLINKGTAFTSAYCQFPLCNPSRTSFMSGWRPDKTGVITNNMDPAQYVPSNVNYLQEYLHSFGYRTECYGKIYHRKFQKEFTWDYKENGLDTAGESDVVGPGEWGIMDGTDSGAQFTLATHLANSLKQKRTQPGFYSIGLITHNPFTPTIENWNKYGDPDVQVDLPGWQSTKTFKGNSSSTINLPTTPENDRADIPPIAFFFNATVSKSDSEWQKTVQAYYGEVSMMDRNLGIILDEMDNDNLWENTVVVLVSDHGQHLGEHNGLWLKNTLFNESLHIPLVICAPGKPSGTCNKLVESVDIYPTITELCRVPAPNNLEGSSMVRLLDNPDQQWKKAVFTQLTPGKNYPLAPKCEGIISENYHYNYWGPYGEELYDRENDPNEYSNLINNPAYAAVLNQMRTIREQGWQNAKPPACDSVIYYQDNDGDGYGNNSVTFKGCYQPIGYSDKGNDCNDSDASVFPGAPDICDGIDNNCNGIIDENCLPSLSILNKSFLEGNDSTRKVAFNISLSRPVTSGVKVNFSTADSTALAGEDYLGGSTIVNFKPGETLKTVKVSIIGDTKVEPNEIFKLLLTNPVNATISKGSAYAVIKNDDNNPITFPTQLIDPAANKSLFNLSPLNTAWPNPAKNLINIRLDTYISNADITLTDTYGSVIKKWNVFNFSDKLITRLEVNDVANGVYFLRIQPNSGNSFTKKIIILH